MIAFSFKVNSSFLENTTHPVTIPKGQVDYTAINTASLHESELSVVFPKGERAVGKLCSGEAGFGHYLQLRFHGEGQRIPDYFSVGDKLIVVLARVGGKSYAIFEYRE